MIGWKLVSAGLGNGGRWWGRRSIPWTSTAILRRNLNLQEYQSKQLMFENDVLVQRFRVANSVEEAEKAVSGGDLSNCVEYVIKAQILAGGRGKGTFKVSGMIGGVQLTKNKAEVSRIVGRMLNDYLITAQTDAEDALVKNGVLVTKVMVAEALDIKSESYLAILLDRESNGPVIVASHRGGVDIEEVAKKSPEDIHKFVVPLESDELSSSFTEKIARSGLGLNQDHLIKKAAKQITNLYRLFIKLDATQVEINPLCVTPDDQVVCFDAKMQFDENASFRQKWMKEYDDENSLEVDPREQLAKKYNLNFVPMDGNIGCLVNGAGLAMATMDIIHHYKGSPANFLDVGGGVNQQGVENAFKLITQDKNVKAILVNIFGGIVNCETVAKGLIAAKSIVKVPLIVRLEGTNQSSAKKLLSKIPDIITATDLDDAAQKAVSMASNNK